MAPSLEIRRGLAEAYPDVLTAAARDALDALAPLDGDRRELMAARMARRLERARHGRRIEYFRSGGTASGVDLWRGHDRRRHL